MTKKTIQPMLLAAACLSLLLISSCEKKACWKCTATKYSTAVAVGYTVAGFPDTIKTDFSVCDKSASEIKEIEKETGSFKKSGNIYISTTEKTACGN